MVQTQGFFDEFAVPAALAEVRELEGCRRSTNALICSALFRLSIRLSSWCSTAIGCSMANRLANSKSRLTSLTEAAKNSPYPDFPRDVSGPQAVHFVFQATPDEYPTLIERFKSVGCELTPVDDEAWKPLS
jgi:hypothetical protein